MSDRVNLIGAIPMRWRRVLPAATLLAFAVWLLGSTGVAHADRFGPPWLAQVTVDWTVVYSRPDSASPPVGPLGRGAIVVVLGESRGADGANWTTIPDGFMRSSDVAELREPWIAEVSVPGVAVYAKPNAKDVIRRTAREGDLLRVTGVSPGLEGDTGIWWATTEGYLPMRTIRSALGEWAKEWTLPDPSDAAKGWWGTVLWNSNVRAGATTKAPIVGVFAGGERVKVLAEEQGQEVGGNAVWYRIDGGRYAGARIHSSLVGRIPAPAPNTTPSPSDAPPGPWIVVDRPAATLTLVKDGSPEFTTYVSIGKAGVATPTGTYSTFGKFRADDMASANVSNAEHSYDLPNVPFTQYYLDGGYAIHGTYWHDRFGMPESQGCINLTWTDAAYLFALTRPEVPDATEVRWASWNWATPVVIWDNRPDSPKDPADAAREKETSDAAAAGETPSASGQN